MDGTRAKRAADGQRPLPISEPLLDCNRRMLCAEGGEAPHPQKAATTSTGRATGGGAT